VGSAVQIVAESGAALVVTRPLFHFNPLPTGRLRIDVDGVLAARLYPGRTVRIYVAPGRQHVVLARHIGVRSKPLEVDLCEGEELDVFAWAPWSTYLTCYSHKRALRCVLAVEVKDRRWARHGKTVKALR
jgi:hypothetical protein